MRIAILAGANSVHSWRWVEYFVHRGHEIYWISLVPFTEPVPVSVRPYEINGYPTDIIATLRASLRVRRILKEITPELLHVHSVGTYGVVGALSRFHPLIATAWGSDVLLATKSLLKRPLIKFVLRQSDMITCDAYHMRDAMVNLGAVSNKIHIVYFGTDTDKFRRDLDDQKVRNQFGLVDQLVVLSTRRLESIYDVATVVRSLPLVLKEISDVRYLIVGQGSEQQRLKALAEELGVADYVYFAGSATGDDMPHYLAAADIYVSTALSDAGLAASTAEAMACELPVVVTESGENQEWVKDKKGGFIVPLSNPEALADKIIYLARRPGERRRFGEYNRIIIEKKNNYHVEMRKIEQLYERITGGYEVD